MGEINFLVVEMTRRCNLRCKHCLRGYPEPTDLDCKEFTNELIQAKINRINILTLSGGEPSLNVSGLENLLEVLKFLKITLNQCCIATNGTYCSKQFIQAIKKIFKYSQKPKECIFAVSRTSYHFESMRDIGIPLPSMAYIGYRLGKKLEDNLYTMGADDKFDEIVAEGRAKGFGIKLPEYGNVINMNVYGQVFSASELSYETQRNAEHRHLIDFIK